MAQQLYTTSSETIANNALAGQSVITTYPVEQGGGCLTWGSNSALNSTGVLTTEYTTGISSSELNYKNRIVTSSANGRTTVADAPDLYAELQNFIAIMTRAQTSSAVTSGLSGANNTQAATSGTVVHTASPRVILFRLQQMVNSMLANPNV